MHAELNLHYLADRRHILTLNQAYKCVYDLAPDSLKNQIKLTRDSNPRPTRSSETLEAIVPRLRLDTSRRSFKYCGAWYWNLIDEDVRKAPSLETFKRRLYSSDFFAPT